MAFAVTPILGFNDALSDPYGYWDAGRTTPAGVQINTPQLGVSVLASDGHTYTFAKASAAVAAAATVVILTEPAMTYATGAGAYTTVTANAALGDVGWIKRTLI